MTEFLIYTAGIIEFYLGKGGLSLIALCLIALVFLTFFITWLIKKDVTKKGKATFILISLCIVFMERQMQTLLQTQSATYLLLAGVGLTFAVILNLPKRKFEPTKSQLNLAREIDEKAKEQSQNEIVKESIIPPIVEKIVTKPVEREKPPEVDFSHVKNVIKRLEYFNLTPNDKRQVKELESAIISAEKGVCDLKTKESVNEGLGCLLKIMSKYGV